MNAACQLVESCGATIAACAFVIELQFLEGRKRLDPHRCEALIEIA